MPWHCPLQNSRVLEAVHACTGLLIREGQHQHCVSMPGKNIRTEKLEFLGHTLKEVKLQLATLLASNSGLAVTVPSTLKKGWLAYNHWGGVQPSDQHP